jgi:hypothetical protein
MQTRSQTASLIAYKFGESQPGVLEVSLMTRGYFPSKVNRVHNILSGCGAVDILGSRAAASFDGGTTSFSRIQSPDSERYTAQISSSRQTSI